MTTDQECEESIAGGAVEVREWAATHPDDPYAQKYRNDYAEPLYEAGAVRCLLDQPEEVAEGITIFETMIVQLPDDPKARRRVVQLYMELQEREDSVDDPTDSVGKRYCRLHFYV